MRSSRRRAAEHDQSTRVVHQAASWCLSYPDAAFVGALGTIAAALEEQPETFAVQRLRAFVASTDGRALADLETEYVAIFDLTRKHALHLSYWTDGDTRRRGEVLAAFKSRYRGSGALVDTHGELPDYLPMVLEFAATVDPDTGNELLRSYRPSIELLRIALSEAGSRYAGVLEAVCATLPGASPQDRAAVMRMAGLGPPSERVGGVLMDVVLWGVLPYLTLVILVAGTLWRYHYDKFGWTTRSSQLYESRLLRIGSPLFHVGILFVLVGHIGGLVVPESWTDALGISEDLYHFNALFFGSIAGICTLGGIAILIYRRRRTGPVFMATTRNDKLMYVVLVAAIVLGLWTTVVSIGAGHDAHNYRESVSPWFRSVFLLRPDTVAMAAAPIQFHIHALVGMLLFAIWPFTRLVHAFTAPLHYLFRPYIVYRSRDESDTPGARSARPGWSPVGTSDREKGRR